LDRDVSSELHPYRLRREPPSAKVVTMTQVTYGKLDWDRTYDGDVIGAIAAGEGLREPIRPVGGIPRDGKWEGVRSAGLADGGGSEAGLAAGAGVVAVDPAHVTELVTLQGPALDRVARWGLDAEDVAVVRDADLEETRSQSTGEAALGGGRLGRDRCLP